MLGREKRGGQNPKQNPELMRMMMMRMHKANTNRDLFVWQRDRISLDLVSPWAVFT